MSNREGMPTQKTEREETLQEKAVNLARALEESRDREYIKSHLPELFAALEELGLSILKGAEVDQAYSLFRAEECLIRVEKFTRIMEAIELDRGFTVGERTRDSHYANAVIPDPEGVRLAFAEGQAPGPIRFAMGIGKSLVGFRPDSDHLTVSEVDFAEDDLRDIAKRRYLCRHVEGEIRKEDIRGAVMRMPRSIVPDSLLTDEEMAGKGQFIFRGFLV